MKKKWIILTITMLAIITVGLLLHGCGKESEPAFALITGATN